ncbi:MAG: phosphoribosylformylglycinamidine synthase subunit PurQ [Coriobacteriales bacterium]|jgi:phosphoribosylformylglycinamidine synthase|nr:phosphoribosylformylglycinamidine synthase subunit PurQ [Coriobacteriales bacterium]
MTDGSTQVGNMRNGNTHVSNTHVSSTHFGVLSFPGSNCDQDVVHALEHLGYQASYVWHNQTDLGGCDALVLPGGFSYGDYLRCGAIARFSPVMESVKAFAAAGHPVIGICNGFQILTEAGLLPGVLLQNRDLKFICQSVHLRVEASVCQWIDLEPGSMIELPIAHGEGNYYCDELTLGRMEAKGQIVLRYCRPDGLVSMGSAAPNGSLDDIAGICNERGNVFGLMPHPERVSDGLNGRDGAYLFQAAVRRLEARALASSSGSVNAQGGIEGGTDGGTEGDAHVGSQSEEQANV